MQDPVQLYKVFMPERLDNRLKEVLYSGKLAYGDYARKFEEKLREYLGNEHVLSVCNTNLTLQIAIDLLNPRQGDEIISSPLSCLATNQPVLTNKAKIVWADVDPQTGTLDPDYVKKKITAKTKAIIHYHWCGYPGYIDEINEVAKNYGIPVIEDASESFGSEYRGKKTGNTGSDIVCFSFGPVRLPTTIEGGAIALKNNELYQKALFMRDYGIDRKNFRDAEGEIDPLSDVRERGYGAMMNEINGCIGYYQLLDFEKTLEKQRRNAAEFSALISAKNSAGSLGRREIKPTNWVFSLLLSDKEAFKIKLKKQNITASMVHLRNDHYSCFGNGPDHELKGVNEFVIRNLNIPSGWWLTDVDRERIAEQLNQLA